MVLPWASSLWQGVLSLWGPEVGAMLREVTPHPYHLGTVSQFC